MSEIKENRVIPLAKLKPHPRNYRQHPDDEIAHIMESIRLHGFYRNIVIAQDGTILAGHGVVEAARKLGITEVPTVQLDYKPDDPRALKLLAGDNEIQHLAETDDRALTELLRELSDMDELFGTGYDEMMLANLVMVTRPAHWVGMPEYDKEGERRIQITVNFVNDEDRKEFCRLLGLDASTINGIGKFIWWPVRVKDDGKSIRFIRKGEND